MTSHGNARAAINHDAVARETWLGLLTAIVQLSEVPRAQCDADHSALAALCGSGHLLSKEERERLSCEVYLCYGLRCRHWLAPGVALGNDQERGKGSGFMIVQDLAPIMGITTPSSPGRYCRGAAGRHCARHDNSGRASVRPGSGKGGHP